MILERLMMMMMTLYLGMPIVCPGCLGCLYAIHIYLAYTCDAAGTGFIVCFGVLHTCGYRS